MDRDELGRLLDRVWCEVKGVDADYYWKSLDADEREKAALIAERFLAAAHPPPRAFWAHVSLMGHRDLGLCRVTEAPLCGAAMLRCESVGVGAAHGDVTWTNPGVVYAMSEISDDAAMKEIAESLERATLKAADESMQKSLLRSRRGGVPAEVIVDEQRNSVYVKTAAGLLDADDRGLAVALRALGCEMHFVDTIYLDGDPCGVEIGRGRGDEPLPPAHRIANALCGLGFASVEVRPVREGEDYSQIPF